MLLSPPTFVESISECSRRLRLQGQKKDATVEVNGDGGRPIGRWRAEWPDQLFDLDPGVTLIPGETLVAKQSLGPDASPFSSVGKQVQASGPSNPTFRLPVIACSKRVVAQGIAPGATVTVQDAVTNAVLATSKGGTVEVIELSHDLGSSERIVLVATACGGNPGTRSAEPPIERLRTLGPDDRRLPPVELPELLLACQRILTVNKTQPGTTFFLERGDGSTITFPLSSDEANLRVDPPLKEGETLTWWVEAESDHCEVQPSEQQRGTVTVGPPGPVSIGTDPCPNSLEMHLSGMIPSATVRLRVDGVDVLEWEAAKAEQDIDLGGLALVAGQRIVAVQRLCNDWSPAAPPVVISPAEDLSPKLVEPLFDCAQVVVIQNVSPGATVLVLSQRLKGELARAIAGGDLTVIEVAPYLAFGDTIDINILGCSPAHLGGPVVGMPDLAEVDVIQAYIGTRTVVVERVLIGAALDIIVSGHHAGGGHAVMDPMDFRLSDPLGRDDTIEVVERLCQQQRRMEPVPATRAPSPAYALLAGGGIDRGGNNWASGQVEVAIAAPGNTIVAGTYEAGVWISHPDGSAEPVSYGWKGAGVRGLAAHPASQIYIFAATVGGLRSTDLSNADPLHHWVDVPLPAAAAGELAAVTVTGDGVLVIAAQAGLFWSKVPGPFQSWDFHADPAVTRSCTAVAWVNGGVVAAAPGAPGSPPAPPALATPPTPPALFRGEWNAGTSSFTWTENANTVQPDFAVRMGRTLLAVCESNRNEVYAMSADIANDMVVGVLRSQDAGRTWTCPHLANNPALDQFQLGKPCDMGLQAVRDIGIAVHPTNPSQILLAGRRSGLLGSTDGGATFDPGAWGPVTDASFHGDCRMITYDTSTGTPRVLVGSDGGLYISRDQDGKSWDSTRNRGMSTMMVVGGPKGYKFAPSLASTPNVPGSCSVGLQDNGEAWSVAGTWWHERVSGDGGRQIAVYGNVLFHAQNEFATLQWSVFTPTELGPSHTVVQPAATPTETRPAFETYLTAVVAPRWKDAAGHLLVAYAAELVGPAPVNPGDPPQIPNLYGIFDFGPGDGDNRFVGVRMARLPGSPSGVASYDGRTAIVCVNDAAGAPHLYRFDAATSTFVESALPAGSTTGSLLGPVMSGRRSGALIWNDTVLVSGDLLTWTASPAGLPGSISALAFDGSERPPALHVATDTRVVVAREGGTLITDASGLPVESRAQQLQILMDNGGGWWAYLGSWAWSVWRAKLR